MFRWLKRALRRLTSISTPVGGMGWTPPPDERDLVYRVLQSLSNRRLVRYEHRPVVSEHRMILSSLDLMRTDLTTTLAETGPDANCRGSLEKIRHTLHGYQTFVEEYYAAGARDVNEDLIQRTVAMQDVVQSELRNLIDAYDLGDRDLPTKGIPFEIPWIVAFKARLKKILFGRGARPPSSQPNDATDENSAP